MGTGFVGAAQTTPEALSALESADKLLFLVGDPLTRIWLEGRNPTAESLYDAYADGKHRLDSYREMVERILEPVRGGLRVCAAFYGHPGVFVNPSHEAIRQARREGFEARMLPAISAEDCLFAELGVDPGALGCQSYEASGFVLARPRFDPRTALVLWQIGAIGIATFMTRSLWNPRGLVALSELLQEHYPEDHEALVYEASHLPVVSSKIQRVTVKTIPEAEVSLLSTLYLPPTEEAPLDRQMMARLGMPLPDDATTSSGAGG